MKKNMKKTVIASILAIGLAAGTSFAHMNTGQPNQQMHGNMKSGCMMNGGMMNGGMNGMHGRMMGSGMMGAGQGNWGMGCNGMMGGNMMYRMTPEQQQEFMNRTVGLRKQMMEKRFTYMEAMRNPETTPEDLAAIEKEMLELRTTMMDEMNI